MAISNCSVSTVSIYDVHHRSFATCSPSSGSGTRPWRCQMLLRASRGSSRRCTTPRMSIAVLDRAVEPHAAWTPSSFTRRLQGIPRCDAATELFPLLETATKYEFNDIAMAAKDHLRDMWPKTLVQWDAYEAGMFDMQRDPSVPTARLRQSMLEPASAIRCAVSFDIPEILRSAFYMLAITPTDAEWSISEDPENRSLYPGARWGLLSKTQLLQYIRGRDRMLADFIGRVQGCVVIEPCHIRQTRGFGAIVTLQLCLEAQANLKAKTTSFSILKGSTHYLYAMKTLEDQCRGVEGLCSECRTRLRGRVDECRSQLWDELVRIFQLM